jgi:uncharacterized membrane protein YczE
MYAEVLFSVGLLLISLAIALMVKADLGISVASSVPYVISLRFPALSFGTWSYLVQGFLVASLVLIVRKIRLAYLLSFGVSVAFGVLLDVFGLWLAPLVLSGYLARAGLFAASLILISLGIACFVASQLPLLPYDLFVKELAAHTNKSFRLCKTLFDFACLLFSALFLLVFVRRLIGLGIGSLLSALLLGSLSGTWLTLIGRHITVQPLLNLGHHPTAGPKNP